MPEIRARVTGVYSGMTLDSVGFFASIVTPIESIAPYGFAVVNLKHAEMVMNKTPKPNLKWKRWWVALTKAQFGTKESINATKYRGSGEGRDEESSQGQQQDRPAFGQEFAGPDPEYLSANYEHRPRSAAPKVSKDPLSTTTVVFIGVSYMVLNGLYWGLGMLPRSFFWDLSRYKCTDVTPSDAQQADQATMTEDHSESHPGFTRTLWYAIRETGQIEWVDRSGAAPGTDQWKRWLREAEGAAIRGERGWKAVQRMSDIMSGKKPEGGMPDERE
ncbi:hypothetical protein K4F52_010042 [Lecanicillium sp. MT-2017a]|nr:hypothetical protein K4F52_010042 [Lecanicillium sp. MT-2017a]